MRDLFEHMDEVPEQEVRELVAKFDEQSEEGDLYALCSRLVSDLKAFGYKCDYGLSGEPYNLRKI